jgi:hypothetical protein
MLESAYQFGWMNSISAQYKFGLEKSWYCGLDLRLDYLTAADTPVDLIEAAVGAQFNIFDFFNPLEVNAKLGLTTYASGIRIGRKFALGSSKKNSLNLEFSIAKHFMTQSRFLINGNKAEDTNKIIDNMLWENVFKNYGYLGGFGISYHFSL